MNKTSSTPENTFICRECSNGCRLFVRPGIEDTWLVQGNKCSRGVAFAYKNCKDTNPGIYRSAEDDFSEKYNILDIMELWGLECGREIRGQFVQGSPERALFRTVVADTNNKKYLLEKIDFKEIKRKNKIAFLLEHLQKKAVPVNPYCRGENGSVVQNFQDGWFLLSPFLRGEPLDRSTYWTDSWRGKEIAHFLCRFYEGASTFDTNSPYFSLNQYVIGLFTQIKTHNILLYRELKEIFAYLEDSFFPYCDRMPQFLCHGDPHPLNILWGDKKIISVIDWEFYGRKPFLYDIALIIGCVGTEHEKAAQGELVSKMVSQLIENRVITEKDLEMLEKFVLALRFAWLSEWLRRDDEEMIAFELSYMQFWLAHCRQKRYFH